MLTEERAEILSNYLTSDPNRAKELFEMYPEEALAEINKEGIDYTLDELNEYCAAFKIAAIQQDKGELTEEELDEVAGGVVVTVALCLKIGGCLLGCFGLGAGIGIACGAKW